MDRVTFWFGLVLVVAPRCAAGFACNYPTQRLTGLADIGRRDSVVKRDLTVRVIGPECEVLIDGGRLRLGPLPSLFGHMTCQSRSGSRFGEGTVQLLRRPLPASGSVRRGSHHSGSDRASSGGIRRAGGSTA